MLSSSRDGKLRARSTTWRIICLSRDCLRYSLVCSRSRRYLQTKKQTWHGREPRLIARPASANTFLLTGVNTRGNFTLKTGPPMMERRLSVQTGQTLGVRVKSERRRADCRLFTEIFPTIICPGGLPREIRKGTDAPPEIGGWLVKLFTRFRG